MAELPFLIVHGVLVAYAVVGVCAAVTLATVLIVRRRRETKRTRDLVSAALTGVSALAPGGRLVRGTLRGSAASVADADKYLGEGARSEQLALEVDGERVELAGNVRVVRGTHATTVASGDRRQFEVRDGDEVIAQGTLARSASDEPTGYREGTVAWTMTPPDAQMPIELTAVRACVKPVPLGAIGVVLVALAGAAIGYCVLWKVGDVLLDRAKRAEGPRRELRAFEPIAIAAATQMRGDALAVLADQLHWGDMRSAPRLRIAIEGMRGDCEDQARALLDDSQLAEALLVAQSCQRVDLQATALRRLGRYREAAALYKQLDGEAASDPTAAILAGDWEIAMNVAVERQRQLRNDPLRDEREQRREADVVCLANWFRIHAGDHEGANQLDWAQYFGMSHICKIAFALVSPDTQARRAALEPLVAEEIYSLDDLAPVRAAIAWAHGAPAQSTLDDALDELPGGGALPMRALLSVAAASARGSDAPDRAIVDAERAVVEVVRGDPQAALAIATTMTPDDVASRAQIDGLAARLALHTPRTPIAIPAGAQLGRHASEILARNGTLAADDEALLDVPVCEPGAGAAIRAASAGDGGPLVALANRCNALAKVSPTLLLAVLPRITKHRTELAAALRDRLAADATGLDDPLHLVQRYALKRDLARAIADEPEADRWQKLLDAQLAALADRDRVIALLLWHAI